jgi:hypothetical protein
MRMRRNALFLCAALVGFTVCLAGTMFVCPPGVDLEINQVRAQIANTSDALGAYRSASGNFPAGEAGLAALLQPTVGGPYLLRMPIDSWGNALVYRRSSQGDAFSLYSRGRNGLDEQGGGDDIVSGTKTYSCEEYGVGCHRTCSWVQRASIVATLLSAGVLLLWIAGAIARWGWGQVSRATA